MTSISRRSFIFMSLALAACKRGAADILLSGQTMGTNYTVVAVDPANSVSKDALQTAINASLAKTDNQMSNWNAGSEISKINTARTSAPIAVSAEMAELLDGANAVHAATEGLFDLTVGPLIDVWGFGAKGKPGHMPSEADIASAMTKVGQGDALRLSDAGLQKLNPEAEMYLSAIGKGYGVDQIGQTLEQFGIENYMVEIGGDILTKGKNAEGMAWQIAIESPDALLRDVQKIVGVSNLGMATSGDYRNYFEEDGQRYSHIIDATTGRPVTHNTASVTVLAENAMLADAWATGLLAMGRERGMIVAEAHDLAVLFIDRDTSKAEKAFVTAASSKFAALT
ncbi:Thiamine biosynthesis lipoprotein ApbE precursor [Shimia sp. SK013]|uniref:FAD:protein FMN transferase n=1 Tax=Shimia sp. SK013 TaxID=1389006 RepID=UPI0006B44817|nr:FAD:protein FMN transferase [Shimia sp. SK013]KPA22484.1 Thiamine biosynthesis lipoprotein ApbE precursor [Shimia sp. SK013]